MPSPAGEIMGTAGQHLGILATGVGLVILFTKGIRAYFRYRKERRNFIPNQLAEIGRRLDSIEDGNRNCRRADDETHRRIEDKLDGLTDDVRLCVPAIGAALDGLIQHDEKINGPVKRWKERLELRVMEGVGTPRRDEP